MRLTTKQLDLFRELLKNHLRKHPNSKYKQLLSIWSKSICGICGNETDGQTRVLGQITCSKCRKSIEKKLKPKDTNNPRK